MALRAAPYHRLPIFIVSHRAGVRLNVSLVSCRRAKLPLNNNVGIRKPGVNVTHFHFDAICYI